MLATLWPVSTAQKPKVIPPPAKLPILGPLVIVDGDCAYFSSETDKRPSKTAFALPGRLKQADYQRAMGLGMRRSGTLVYRPVCPGCRKCRFYPAGLRSLLRSSGVK